MPRAHINTLVNATPVLFGVVGLQTQGVTNPIINLAGTIGLASGTTGTTALLQVVRGVSLTAGPVIYSAIFTQNSLGTFINNFSVQDLLAPSAPQTAYTAFLSGVTGVSRIGPEVLWGTASSGGTAPAG